MLPQDCVVLEATPITLLVKRSPVTDSPSLFEEAITLSKLRGLLAARPSLPRATSQKAKLQNGTATIPFSKPLPPAELADVISDSLGLEGVQKVRAVWSQN